MIGPCLSDKLHDWQLIELAGGHEIIDGKDILDLGPSLAVDAYMFWRRSKSYTVIDSDPEILLNLRRVFGSIAKVTIIERNLQHELPFADDTFDTVFDFGTIDNVLGGLTPYGEAWRVLKPGGTFLVSFANRLAFDDDFSPSGDEQRFHRDQILDSLPYGYSWVRATNPEAPRSGMVIRK